MTIPSTPRSTSTSSISGTNVKAALAITAVFTVFIWFLEGIDYILPIDMDAWGVHGWSLTGFFPGFLLMPVLHAGFGHLISNTVPIIVLGILSAVKGLRPFLAATAIVLVVTGIGVWFTSPGVVTVGASGMIFGYFGYLIGRGLF
ncbi:MAG: rhomboid family intramembrane serine protease, partial [Stackebrandtia sp.]